MKKFLALASLALCLCLLTGCMGTPVVYSCTCATSGSAPAVPVPPAEGDLKTGLAIITSLKKSTSATESANGKADYDVTMVAVLVDDNGIIRDCIIDSIATSVEIDKTGKLVTDKTAVIQTKNELGDSYATMPAGSWKKQAQALADYAIGKTIDQVKNGAVDESGKAPAGSDLASSATIYLGGYVLGIEKAVNNAKHLGADAGDSLHFACTPGIKSSTDGLAQLDADVTALSMKDGVITSCVIDSIYAQVYFTDTGAINTEKTDISKPSESKNELGDRYNMVNHSKPQAIAEWDVQAARFAAYVTGKTLAQVEGIAVDATTKPTGSDLSTSVTISIGGFQALIRKAAQ